MVSYAVYIKTHSMGFIYFLNWGGGGDFYEMCECEFSVYPIPISDLCNCFTLFVSFIRDWL